MANVHVFKQNYRTQKGDMSTDLGAETTPDTDSITTPVFVDMRNYDLVRGVGQVSGISSDSVITLRLWEATASGGGGSQSLTHTYASVTNTSTHATAVDILEVQARGEDLSSGYRYVGAKLSSTEAAGSQVASVHLVQGRSRYKQTTMPT